MLYKDIPFVRFTLPLAAGILLRYYTDYTPVYYILIPVIIAILLAYKLSDDRLKSVYYGLGVCVFFTIAGYLLYSQKYSSVISLKAMPGTYTVRIDEKPVSRERSIKVPSSLITKNRKGKYKAKAKIMLYFPDESDIAGKSPGSLIRLKLLPSEIQDFDTLDSFDYRKYMIHSGYKYYSFAAKYAPTGEYSVGIKHKSAIIQQKLLARYSSRIDNQRSLAIVSALTLGYRDYLDEEIREKFMEAGISHIMAVSGLHVGIIMLIASSLLKVIRIRSRFLSIIIIILSVWTFALISGMSPSVSRASIMFTFISTGKHIGRHVNPVNSLLASAFILLILNPFILFSASFQLSYSAVLTILLFFKKVDNLIKFSGLLLRKLWSLISVTLLAQAGTLPFVLYYFKSVAPLSVFTNILAIPLTFLIVLTGLMLLVVPSSLFVSDILAWLVTLESKLLYSIADWISSF